MDPKTRLEQLTEKERELQGSGITKVAGVDEAGRGPLAGPVVAACVIFSPGTWVQGVDDSKKLSAARREKLYAEIMERAAAVGIGIADVETIEGINILEATRQASLEAIGNLGIEPEFLFTDALHLDVPYPKEAVVRADAQIYCVAAASVIAKVTRDRIMLELDKQHPEYGFAQHKGYGTKAHREAILAHGPVLGVHRPKFLRKLLQEAGTVSWTWNRQ